MKTFSILFLAATLIAAAQDEPAPADPTRPSPKMRAALVGGGIPPLSVKGLVLSADRERALVMFDSGEGGLVAVRPGAQFSVVAGGELRKLQLKKIDEAGIEIESVEQKESIVLGNFSLPAAQRGGVPGEVDYVEFRDLPLIEALRMLSDQTGQNFSASVDANKILVNVMLRNVAAQSVVEEICKSHGLWFRRDATSRIMRIMTVGEFEKDLAGYREEETEVFTLKYPNVNEIAFAIADLYGDRVEFSLGGEESDEDMRKDLEGRFDRFDVLNYRTQSAGGVNGGVNGNVLGGNVNGFFSNGGSTYGFGGSGGNNRFGEGENSRYSRGRGSRRESAEEQADEGLFRTLTPEQVERVERAIVREAQTANVEALRKRRATIYVTASRRNNQIAVRTADAGALAAIRELVVRMDVQTPMVLLEVKVVSIDLGREFRSAFDYQFNDGTIGASFSRADVGRPAGGGATVGSQLPFGASGLASAGFNSGDMTFVVVSDNFRARMQLFEQKNRVKTLSTPTLLTANNEVSRIFLGEQRPIVTGISSQTILTDNNVATTPNTTTEIRNVGTTLLITPNINSDRTVTLRLVQDNSFISPNGASIPVVTNTNRTGLLNNDNSPVTGVQNVPVDVVASRTVSGTFVAKDGMAIAVGGLIEDVDSDRRGQVPVLGDIPGLGFFFQRKQREKSRRELVMMIRPYVLTTPADGEKVSRDMLTRLAPTSVERLLDEGFLQALPATPVARPIRRPAGGSEVKATMPGKGASGEKSRRTK